MSRTILVIIGPTLLVLGLPFVATSHGFTNLLHNSSIVVRNQPWQPASFVLTFFYQTQVHVRQRANTSVIVATSRFYRVRVRQFDPPRHRVFLQLYSNLFHLTRVDFSFFSAAPTGIQAFFVLHIGRYQPHPLFPMFHAFGRRRDAFRAIFGALYVAANTTFTIVPRGGKLAKQSRHNRSFRFVGYLYKFANPLSTMSNGPLHPYFLAFDRHTIFVLGLSNG